MLRTVATALPLVAVLAFPACQRAPATNDDATLDVVCTTTMLTDIARAIAGEDARVTGLMGPGVDPHLYAMTRADQKALLDADLVIYHGLHLEGKMVEFLTELGADSEDAAPGERRKVVVAAAEAIPKERLIQNPLFGEYPDPHVWFDLELWQAAVRRVAEAFVTADPSRREAYLERGRRYESELAELHTWAKSQAEKIPESRRRIVTSHDAFNYLGRAYGFDVRGLQGISTETQAGLKDIEEAIQYIREHDVPVVFAETSVRSAEIEHVARNAGCRLSDRKLYSDALGSPATPEGTFTGMFRHNLRTIVEELGGN